MVKTADFQICGPDQPSLIFLVSLGPVLP